MNYIQPASHFRRCHNRNVQTETNSATATQQSELTPEQDQERKYEIAANKLYTLLKNNQLMDEVEVKFENNLPTNITTLTSFLEYTQQEDFNKLRNEFINNLRELKDNANRCISNDNKTLIQDINKIDELIAKINSPKEYAEKKPAIFQLFFSSRTQIYKINTILSRCAEYYAKSKEQTGATEKNIIDQNTLETIISDLVPDIGKCVPGIVCRIDDCYNSIKAELSDINGELQQAKENLVKNRVDEFHRHRLLKYGNDLSPGMHVHRIYGFINFFVKSLGLADKTADNLAISVDAKDTELVKELENLKTTEFTPFDIINSMAVKIYAKLNDLIDYTNMQDIRKEGVTIEKHANTFYSSIKNFIANINQKFATSPEKLTTDDVIKAEGVKSLSYAFVECLNSTNTVMYTDVGDKLHALIALKIFDKTNVKLRQLANTADGNSSIVQLANSFFGVIPKQDVASNIDISIDFNNYTAIELKHLSNDTLTSLAELTRISIIKQALLNTNNAQDIVTFFNDNAELIKNDSNLLTVVNEIISNRITTNKELKQGLITLIYNDCCQTNNRVKFFNSEEHYWYLDSKLLEPVLLKIVDNIADNKIDISDVVKKLNPEQILNLEYPDSLEKITSVVKNKDSMPNLDFFMERFEMLIKMKKITTIINLIRSTLMDDFLIAKIHENKSAFNRKLRRILGKDIIGIKQLYRITKDQKEFKIFHDALNKTKLPYDELSAVLMRLAIEDIPPHSNKKKILSYCFISAIEHKDIEKVKLLLQNKYVNKNRQNIEGYTPFSIAIRMKNLELVKLLLNDKNIDKNKPNKSGDTPLNVAISSNNVELVELLLQNKDIDKNLGNVCPGPLTSATISGNLEIIKLLLKNKDIKINQSTIEDDADNALIVAIAFEELEIVKLLLQNKVDKNQPEFDKTPYLDDAEETGNTAIIELLKRA